MSSRAPRAQQRASCTSRAPRANQHSCIPSFTAETGVHRARRARNGVHRLRRRRNRCSAPGGRGVPVAPPVRRRKYVVKLDPAIRLLPPAWRPAPRPGLVPRRAGVVHPVVYPGRRRSGGENRSSYRILQPVFFRRPGGRPHPPALFHAGPAWSTRGGARLQKSAHSQSLTKCLSPMRSSLGEFGSSPHRIRATPSVMSLTDPQ